MARLVPARPLVSSAAEEAAVTSLERSLDDTFVIIQPSAALPGLLILHPALGACVVAVRGGEAKYNADLADWQIDGAPVGSTDAVYSLSRLSSALPGVSGTVPALLFLPEASPPFGGDAVVDAAALSGRVRTAAAASRAEIDMDAVMAAIAPGAAPYAPGSVTEAQAEWRASVQQTDPVQQSIKKPELPKIALDGKATSDDVFVPVTKKDPEPARTRFKNMQRMLEACVANAAADRPLFVAGVALQPADFAQADFMLPALLIAAAESWAPVVAGRGGKGGFLIRMKYNERALLGYEVVDIDPSAPLLTFVPIVNLIRRSAADGECILDNVTDTFAQWLRTNELDAEVLDLVDVRIATSV